nr:protein kinase [Acidobacteriota bacterium]
MSVAPGTRLSHYEIRSQIGAGGMGEVYLAQDIRLRRSVALKILPLEFTENAARLRRFEQEASTASGLNHPNIITIHEISSEGDIHFI